MMMAVEETALQDRREGERNGQPIRHPNDNIADEG